MNFRTSENGVRMPPDVYIIDLEYKSLRGGWTMQFNLMQLLSTATPIKDVRKVLTYIARNREYWKDDYTPLIDAWISYLVYNANDQYKFAGNTYANDFRLPDNGRVVNGRTIPYTKKEIKDIQANNKRMLNAIKSAKRDIERYEKRADLWDELKDKYLK